MYLDCVKTCMWQRGLMLKWENSLWVYASGAVHIWMEGIKQFWHQSSLTKQIFNAESGYWAAFKRGWSICPIKGEVPFETAT